MAGQGHVMLEFGFLAGQVGLLDGGALLLGQGIRLVPHGKSDGAQGQDQRRDGQENDFLSEFHGLARTPVASMRVERGDFTSPRGDRPA